MEAVMTKGWELEVFAWIAIVSFAWILLLVGKAWWDDRRKWKQVKPHYGSQYDASTPPRPNIRLVRP
jgi:hypothetical protein